MIPRTNILRSHCRRALVAALMVVIPQFCAGVSPAQAWAELDNQLSVLDEQGQTLTVEQWDTALQGIYPMDRNRLTREWFYSGSGVYRVAGPEADKFAGQLSLGYQIGFPWSLGVGINFSYTSPNILLDGTNFEPGPGFSPLAYVITPNFFPGVSISADLGNGPGVTEIVTFTSDVSGAEGNVLVSDAHGTVTGAAGGVLLRPFVRLVSTTGATVTTYGEPWNMN